jgi:hypothetical protein
LKIFVEIYIQVETFKFSYKDTNKTFKVFDVNNPKAFTLKRDHQLEKGDIVQLLQEDVSPGNILIITNYHRYNKSDYCLVENFLINERLKITKKKGIHKLKSKTVLETQESIIKYLKNLTFNFEYSWTEEDYSDFLGILKIRKDPKPE